MQSKRERKRQRRIITILLILAGVLCVGLIVLFIFDRSATNRSVAFRIQGANVQIYRAKKWQDFVIKGVNMSPESGENGLSKAEYERLFKRLTSLDINVIRINDIFRPAFYQALFEYNMLTSKPLYLLQGIRLDERYSKTYRNAYDAKLGAGFADEIKLIIDAIHGNVGAKQQDGQVSAKYNLDVAPFVLGFNFLFDEGKDESDFVITTNKRNRGVMGFEGDYLYTEDATPFEAWLAGEGNFAIAYEQEKYGGPDRLASWMSWSNTDPLVQLDEPDNSKADNSRTDDSQADDSNANDSNANDSKAGKNPAAVNLEHIKSTERFNAGILAVRQLREKFIEYNEL